MVSVMWAKQSNKPTIGFITTPSVPIPRPFANPFAPFVRAPTYGSIITKPDAAKSTPAPTMSKTGLEIADAATTT